MITELFIKNFTIIDQNQIPFQKGMSVITGETGAGKSILLDALGLLLGNRANTQFIRLGAAQADISAVFDISQHPTIQTYLTTQSLENTQLILRRVITTDGRSKAFINGTPATLQQLKTLSPWLVHVHGQHDHHALLQPAHQLDRLDYFANHPTLLQTVKTAYLAYQTALTEYNSAQSHLNENHAERALLQYQVTELDQLDLGENEYDAIQESHQRLSHAQDLLQGSHQLIEGIQESTEHALLDQLAQHKAQLETLSQLDQQLRPIDQLLEEAYVSLQEAGNSLKHYHQTIEANPEQQQLTEQRLTHCIELARKHDITPEQLYTHHQALKQTLQQLDLSAEHLPQLEQACQKALQAYKDAAQTLYQSRQNAAHKLGPAVTQYLKQLGFKYGQFTIHIEHNPESIQPLGSDHLQFQVRTNQGQPIQAMQKIVSGGELSRISLAIQMLTAAKHTTPTLIFDEVDTGVGGGIAETIGQLLKQLGQHCQVLCVTHLAQIASQAEQHLHIDKIQTDTDTQSSVKVLNQSGRIQEIARMIGGG